MPAAQVEKVLLGAPACGIEDPLRNPALGHAGHLRLRGRRGTRQGNRPHDLRGPVNFLDTSRIYGFGRSEERIGAVIRERGGPPEGFIISTKLDRDPETNRFDASQARRSLEES